MDSNTALPVKLGPYVNRVTGDTLWLLPSNAAGLAVQFLGIWLTLALPRIWVTVITLYRQGTSARGQHAESVLDPGEYALERFWDAGLPRNRLPTEALPRRDRRMALKDFGIASASALIFVLVIVLGTLANLLSGDSTALIASPTCGYYGIIKDGPRPAKFLSLNRNSRRQGAVGSYARDCYDGRGNTLEGCNLFTKQSLPYGAEDDIPCPFGGDMCVTGAETGAIKFSTPPLPAEYLGLNLGASLEFERTTTCAPLVRNSSFLSHAKPPNQDTSGSWNYDYGPANVVGSNYSFVYPSRNHIVIDGFYSVSVVSERGSSLEPIEALRQRPDSIVTLVFIDNSRTGYLDEGFDPVFYAHDQIQTPDPANKETYWLSYVHWVDLAPRVLACAEAFNMRSQHGAKEWSNSEAPPEQSTSSERDEWTLVHSVLLKSTIYESSWMRSGTALNASSQLMLDFGRLSLSLPEDQWKAEARQMFEASLANAQFEARRIGLGTDATDPAFGKMNEHDSICDYLFMINAPGYTNVYLAPWLAIFLLSTVIIIVTFPVGSRDHRKLVFEFLPESLLKILRQCAVVSVDSAASCLRWISRSTVALGTMCWKTVLAVWDWIGKSITKLMT
ncbi:hypothetical protein LTR95_015747 [Oleoguttula sp. CCFEE 5521]